MLLRIENNRTLICFFVLTGHWPTCWTVLEIVLLVETCSSFHLIAITLTRYIAVVHPLRYQAILTHKNALVAVAMTWSLALLTTLIIYWPIEPGEVKSLYKPLLDLNLTQITCTRTPCVTFFSKLLTAPRDALGVIHRLMNPSPIS